MRNSNGHEIIHMNKFITNAYLMQARKTLISLPMIRTYMVICLLHMYQLSTGIRPFPFFFILQTLGHCPIPLLAGEFMTYSYS